MKTIFTFLCLLTATTFYSQQFNTAIQLGGSGYDNIDGITTSGGDIYVTGRFESSMDADPGAGVFTLTSAGGADVFVAKLTSDLSTLIWAKSFGGPQGDYAAGISVMNNEVVVTGAFRNTADLDPDAGVVSVISNGDEDVFVVKLNANSGSLVWAKAIGDLYEDHPEGVSIDPSGNINVCGLFSEFMDFDPGIGISYISSTGFQDAFILQLQSDGTFSWARTFGTDPGEFCYDIETDASGNVFATGLFTGTMDADPGAGTFDLVGDPNYFQCFALKWSSSGDFIWAGQFGGSQSDSAYDIEIDGTGNMIVSGYFNGTGDFNPGAGVFNLVTESSLFFADIFILKLENDGDFIWAKGIGVNGSLQTTYGMTTSPNGDIFLTGLYDQSVDFDPGPGVFTLSNYGSGDSFILQVDANGDFIWAGHVGGTQTDYGNGLVYLNGNVIAAGAFSWNNVDLDPTDETSLFTSTSFSNDGYLISFTVSDCEQDLVSVDVLLCPGETYFAEGAEQSTAGVYQDIYTNAAGCDSIIETTITLSVMNWIPLVDTVGCDISSLEILNNTIAGMYTWSTGSFDPTITVTEAGIYSMYMLSEDGCTVYDTVNVSFGQSPVISFELPETACGGSGTVTAMVEGEEPFSYLWNDPDAQTTATAVGLETGNYSVTVEDVNGCETSADVDVETAATTCPADFDGDGVITVSDMIPFVAAYGCVTDCCPYDLTGDGIVSVADLINFITAFGTFCP